MKDNQELTNLTAALPLSPRRKPLISIEPERRWYDLDWDGAWRRSDLLGSLVLRDVRLRYRQTLLGVLWTVLQPLAPMLIFTFVFHRVFADAQTVVPYSFFVLSGLVVWLFFSSAVAAAGNSLINHSYLIGKIYFPRLLLPLAAVAVGTVELAVGFAFLLVAAFWLSVNLSWEILFAPLLLVLAAWLALAAGVICASVSIVYRDVRNIMPFLLQLWLFLTPIIYPLNALPDNWRWVVKLNPLTGIIENFRAVLVGSPKDWEILAAAFVWCIVLSFAAMILFGRMERYAADYL